MAHFLISDLSGLEITQFSISKCISSSWNPPCYTFHTQRQNHLMCSDSCQTALSSPKDRPCLLFQSVNITVTALLIIHKFWIVSYIPQMEQSLGTSALPVPLSHPRLPGVSGVLGAVPGMGGENKVSLWCSLTFPSKKRTKKTPLSSQQQKH